VQIFMETPDMTVIVQEGDHNFFAQLLFAFTYKFGKTIFPIDYDVKRKFKQANIPISQDI